MGLTTEFGNFFFIHLLFITFALAHQNDVTLSGVSSGDIDVFMDESCFFSLPYVENLRIIPTTEYAASVVYVCVFEGLVEAQVTNHIRVNY